MNALRAQAVAARSFGLSQNRYSYAKTCDTSSCQVYGGSATRPLPTSAGFVGVEHVLTNQAIAETAGTVRMKQRRHRLDRVLGVERPAHRRRSVPAGRRPVGRRARQPATTSGPASSTPTPSPRRTGSPTPHGVGTVHDASSTFDGIWANKVVRGSTTLATAWDFRNAFGLPSPGFVLVPIVRGVSNSSTLLVHRRLGRRERRRQRRRGVPDPARRSVRLDDVRHARVAPHPGWFDADGVAAAAAVPVGTDLVVVELGYNDDVRRDGGPHRCRHGQRCATARSAASPGSTCRSGGPSSPPPTPPSPPPPTGGAACSCSTGSRPATTWRATGGSPTTFISRPRDAPSSRCSCTIR